MVQRGNGKNFEHCQAFEKFVEKLIVTKVKIFKKLIADLETFFSYTSPKKHPKLHMF